jgi:predicted lipoprotein with Yx(FWY)xxD motif
MKTAVRGTILALALSAALVAAGCGASTGNTPAAGQPTATPVPATSTPTTAPVVSTAQAMVGGKSETILVDGLGLTLYYLTSDTASSSACTGACAQAWPPLLDPSGTPTGPASLPGHLGVVGDANGAQVTYNGHPLYTYSGDSKPGDTTGQGVRGVWFVVTPGLAVQAGATPTAIRY